MCLSIPAWSRTLNAGISYTVENARIEAFSDIEENINIRDYEKYLIDKNKNENLKLLSKNKSQCSDRYMMKYSDSEYAIMYKVNTKNAYYYNKDGQLQSIGISYSEIYPKKGVMYDLNGQILTTVLTVSYNNDYIFDLNKKLIFHWIGRNCYNESGELILTRD